MARLTAAARRALPDSAFAGPNRSFPVHDAKHAKAANMLKNKGHANAATKRRIKLALAKFSASRK